MESLTSAISVQVDARDKELANEILRNLGLNMSTFVNMAIKQLIYKNGLPFEANNPKPNKHLMDALKEGEDILNGKVEAKGYHDVRKMVEDILNEK